MGLDIRVISDAKFVANSDVLSDDEFDTYCDEYHFVLAHPDFPEQADGAETGFYNANREFSFRAGSYGGYNEWRSQLARLALDTQPEAIWRDTDAFKGKPFFEIINFSDCEGAIGPKTSEKLYRDFEKNLEKAKEIDKQYSLPGMFLRVYEDFMEAFRVASTKNGFVIFC